MAFTNKSVNGYHVGTEESLTLPDSAGANETSVNTTSVTSDLSDKKFLVSVTVTEATAGNGAAEVRAQASLDDSNWVTVDTTSSMALDTTGLNTAVEEIDLSSIFAPYYRFQVFTDGTDTQDAGTLTVSYAFNLP